MAAGKDGRSSVAHAVPGPARWRDRRDSREHRGHTRWRRFAVAIGIGGVATGLLTFGLSQGALAASFAVSGSSFKVNAEKLTGDGLVLYGGEIRSADGAKAVATLGVRKASINDFCTGFVVKNLPVLGSVSIKLTNPGSLAGDNLILDVSDLNAGNLTLHDTQIGRDAGRLTGGPVDALGPAGSAGVQAAALEVSGLRGDTWALTAGTVSMNGVHLTARPGSKNTCD
ncbi:MAG: DUF6230 family protein [Pseudonocardiaceae bacterium]